MGLALASRDYDSQGNLKQFISPVRIIDSYINGRGENSIKTKQEYAYDIEQFFVVRKGKELEYLTEKDLEIDIMEVEEYRKEIKEDYEYANSSINRKITVLRNLYEYLENFYKNNENIRARAFNVKAWKHDVQHYDSLSLDEIDQFAELALQEKFKPWEKHYLIKLAQRVSFRIGVLLKLKWSDINRHDFREDAYIVTGRGGKGQKTHKRPIHVDFYNELLTLKEKYDKVYDDDYIFHLNKMDASRMIKRFSEKLNISEGRNIVFHSLRRFGSNFVKNATGDITLAKEQLDHEDIRTTMIYTDENGNVDLSVGMLLDSKQDRSIIDNMTADEWKDLFIKASIETQINLLLNARNTMH